MLDLVEYTRCSGKIQLNVCACSNGTFGGCVHESTFFKDGSNKFCMHERNERRQALERRQCECATRHYIPAQKNEFPSVCRGNTMLRAMPKLEKGLPTSVFAYASMSCSDLFEHPSCTYEYCTEKHTV